MSVALPPDDRDWTWILQLPCPECGLDVTSISGPQAGAALPDVAAAWCQLLMSDPHPEVRSDPARWSVLEYGCHVRDVLGRFVERASAMRDRDNPTFANWDQDATAVADRYHLQAAEGVAQQIGAACRSAVALVAGLSGDQWERRGRRSDGAAFTIDSFTRYVLHDPVHHLHDVGAPWAQAPWRSGHA